MLTLCMFIGIFPFHYIHNCSPSHVPGVPTFKRDADVKISSSVDALDECTNRETILEMLHSLNDFANDSIKTLFTGREEIDIQKALNDYDRLSIAANTHNIRLYVDLEISRRTKNRSPRVRDPALQGEIRERLVNKAEGM